jgi:hypothetical protein
MEELGIRSLERICRIQAALTTHEATKRVLETMAEEYRRQAEFQDRQQAQESRQTGRGATRQARDKFDSVAAADVLRIAHCYHN